ncbi:MAG: 4Fe-4S dicluster domain-containing protein [Actinobacteria bacterium]|nr:4Fe-4S dicluster domain-containing protein [Actinomycetota bacterium]
MDQERCDGCAKCAEACSLFHTGTSDPARSRIRILGLENHQLFAPSTCQHCETPFCTEACPTRACHRDEESHAVLIDPEVCMGCKTCIVACPFGAPTFDELEGVSIKCDYCQGEPQCVAVCEPGAISYVFSDENNLRRRRRHGLKVYGWRHAASPGE